jgi:hypothetical protein
MLEAINENRTGCFGWAIHHVVDDIPRWHFVPEHESCEHHHKNRFNLVGKSSKHLHKASTGSRDKEHDMSSENGKSWAWFITWTEFKGHYSHELGFLACASQLFGATVFWISGFTALPGIFNHLSGNLLNGIFWVPQVIGGSGFVISGTLFMIETQKSWYKPAFGVLGWYVGLFNLIGGIGFTLCPIFGFYPSLVYQSALATYWGSWAFLIGSLAQLYESLEKNPVQEISESELKEEFA